MKKIRNLQLSKYYYLQFTKQICCTQLTFVATVVKYRKVNESKQ